MTADLFHCYFLSFQDAFPLRFKGMHFINEPVIFNYVFMIFKPFMKSKMVARVGYLITALIIRALVPICLIIVLGL